MKPTSQLLVTGGTGFIGRTLVRRLGEVGYPMRLLLHTSPRSPNIPRGVAVEAALASLTDWRGLRAAMVGVKGVIHLASASTQGIRTELEAVDVEGTHHLARAAADAGVERLIFLSHLGASRASAYPVLKAKAEAEEAIRDSGVPHTIIRSACVFGEGDHLTEPLAMLLALAPVVFPIPGSGDAPLQPLWIEDLVTALTWLLDEPTAAAEIIEVGGPEFFSFRRIVEVVMRHTGYVRIPVSVHPPFLRPITRLLARALRYSPVSDAWLDYLATGRTAELDTLPRRFRLQPAAFESRLDYLDTRNWGWEFVARQLRRPGGRF
jgi:uncharacterized protein YbjT (DUF2867 family)